MHARALTTTRNDEGTDVKFDFHPKWIRFGDDCLVATLNSMRPLDQARADQAGAAVLSAPAIVQALDPAWRNACAVEAVPVTVSTNEDLVARARAQQPARHLLRAADFQSGGRGRKKRHWRAAPGDALLFSVAVPLAGASQSLPAITLACGVALAESLAQCGIAVQLKWPNDIRIEGRKLGGILTELVTDRVARQTLVVGVGVNLHLDEATRRSIRQPAIALDQLPEAAARQSREQWIGQFGSAIFNAAAQFMQDGFDPFRARFNGLLESRGEHVDVLHDEPGIPPISGRVIEVDPDGRLVIEAEGQRHAVSVGDVSVRR
jgi:BirA family transcriptional regulator, biotin operon repressor / biotin---[acetyl-CoA-carboxylase] ligase